MNFGTQESDDRHSDYVRISYDRFLLYHGEEHEGRQCTYLQCDTAVYAFVRGVDHPLAVFHAGALLDIG